MLKVVKLSLLALTLGLFLNVFIPVEISYAQSIGDCYDTKKPPAKDEECDRPDPKKLTESICLFFGGGTYPTNSYAGKPDTVGKCKSVAGNVVYLWQSENSTGKYVYSVGKCLDGTTPKAGSKCPTPDTKKLDKDICLKNSDNTYAADPTDGKCPKPTEQTLYKKSTTGGGGGGGTFNPARECDPDLDDASNALCVPKNPACDVNSESLACKGGTVLGIIAQIIKYLLYVAGAIAVVFVIIGGYTYMTARGNDEQASKGRKTLTNALIGLVIVILAFVIVRVVVTFLTGT